MRLDGFEHDPDPLPRAAPVGPGSAYAPVAEAILVEPTSVTELVGAADIAPRRERALATWRFAPGRSRPAAEADEWRLVSVPHVWARAEPDLADHKGPCWYQREVELEPSGRHQLRFEALDYVAAVHIDGMPVAAHEGGFTPVAVDLPTGVTGVDVAIRVDDPPEEQMLGPDPLTAAKRKVKGVQEFHDSRPGGFAVSLWWRSEAALRWGSGGVADRVSVITTREVRLEATFVTAAGTDLAISWVLTNMADHSLGVELRSLVDGSAGVTPGLLVRATLAPGASRVAVKGRADGLAPWSPADPQVHELATDVRIVGDTVAGVSDSGRVSFGARRVDMGVEGDDRYQLHLDGQRTYVRAANYIPGVWWSELTTDLFVRDLELAQAANINSFGPHALALPKRFYDAADAAGCLVFQDMPLNLGHDTAGPPLFEGGPTMAEAGLLLAAELTYHLYNHPSVVYWCGHNEPGYQLAELFRGGQHPDIVAIHQKLEALPDEEELDRQRMEQWQHIDPTRPAWMASGLGRHRDGGDIHTYTGSLSTDPATGITEVVTPFLSEFGAWTTNFSGAHAPGAAGDWPPPPEAIGTWEHRTHIWWSSALHAGRPERYPDFPTATFGAQLFGGVYLKLAIESQRRRKWAPTGAHRYHLWVDHWGDAGAGVVDRHRVRQLHYWALAAANRPLLPMIEFPRSMRVEPGAPVQLRTWVVNDHHGPERTHELRWEVARLAEHERHLLGVDDPQVASAFGEPKPTAGDLVVLPSGRGQTVASGGGPVLVHPDAAVEGPVVEVTLDDDDPTAYAVWVTLEGPDGPIDNWAAFVVAPSGWEAAPGLSPVPRFPLTVRGAAHSVVRRWTGQTVAEGTGEARHVLPPDQYVVAWAGRRLAVDLFAGVVVDLDLGEAIADTDLPWAFDPAPER